MSARTVASLLVRGVRWTTSPAMLRQYFGLYGKVRVCRIIYNMQTGYSRNFARVELEMTPKGAGELAAGPHVVNQFPVEVVFQEKRPPPEPEPELQEKSQ